MNDETRIDQLVSHLNATQKSFETEAGLLQHVSPSFQRRAAAGNAALNACSPLLSVAEAVCRRLVVGPDGTAGQMRTAWDALLTLLMVASCIGIPLRLAFPAGFPRDSWDPAELTVDALLAIDLFVSLFTPYYRDGRSLLVTNPSHVLGHNLKRTLPLDIAAAFPVALVLRTYCTPYDHPTSAGDDGVQMLGLLRLVQLLRMVKAALRTSLSVQTTLLIKSVKNKMNGSIRFLVQLMVVIFMTWHWIACAWWFIVTNDGSAATWGGAVGAANGSSAAVAGHQEDWWFVEMGHAQDSSVVGAPSFYRSFWGARCYGVALHWTIQIIIGVGAPVGVCSGWQAGIENVTSAIGVVMQCFFFGAAAATLNQYDEVRRQRRQKLEAVRIFISQRDVPPYVGQRVIDFYEYMATRMQVPNQATAPSCGSLPQ